MYIIWHSSQWISLFGTVITWIQVYYICPYEHLVLLIIINHVILTSKLIICFQRRYIVILTYQLVADLVICSAININLCMPLFSASHLIILWNSYRYAYSLFTPTLLNWLEKLWSRDRNRNICLFCRSAGEEQSFRRILYQALKVQAGIRTIQYQNIPTWNNIKWYIYVYILARNIFHFGLYNKYFIFKNDPERNNLCKQETRN